MTMNLITGKAGAPHITSSDQGAMQAGLVGNGNYLLQGSDGKFPAVTMQSANKALIPVLNLVIEGRYARVTAAETVTIESGVTGRNRNDLICVKYTRGSNNIETIALAVLKGTATSGTAADPTVPSGSILNNSGTVWIPIARIPISGITAGTPVMLVKQLPPMSQLWDSVTLTKTTSDKLVIDTSIIPLACAQSGADALLVLSILWQNSGRFRSVSWGSVNLATVKGWKAARESFGWCFDNNIDSSTQSTARFYMANNIISWRDSSEHDIAAGCWHNGGLIVPVMRD